MKHVYGFCTEAWHPVVGCREGLPCAERCWLKPVIKRLAGSPDPKVWRAHEDLVGRNLNANPIGGDPICIDDLPLVWTGTVRLNSGHLLDPLSWRKVRRIATGYHGDLALLPDEDKDQIVATMLLAHWHQFFVLTKRPELLVPYLLAIGRDPMKRLAEDIASVAGHIAGAAGLSEDSADEFARRIDPDNGGWPPQHVWFGISAEDQPLLDQRARHAMKLAAAGWHTWLSLEPLIGPVDLFGMLGPDCGSTLRGGWRGGFEFVVVGFESGPDARPGHPDWARCVRDDCAATGVPFNFKQWGEFVDGRNAPRTNEPLTPDNFVWVNHDGRWRPGHDAEFGSGPDTIAMYRLGKKAAGRLLDGHEYDGLPEVR